MAAKSNSSSLILIFLNVGGNSHGMDLLMHWLQGFNLLHFIFFLLQEMQEIGRMSVMISCNLISCGVCGPKNKIFSSRSQHSLSQKKKRRLDQGAVTGICKESRDSNVD